MKFSNIGTLSLALLLAIAPLIPAAPVTTDDNKGKAESQAEKTRKALEQTRDIEIVEQALPTAIATLKDMTKINFVFDHQVVLNTTGVDPNVVVVTFKQKNVKVRTALRTILASHHLSMVILGDTVVVTTEDVAMQRQMKQRVSVDVDAVPLHNALRNLARETATNLLIDSKVKKESEAAVSLQLEDVPLESAVRLLCEMSGLKMVRLGNVLYVTNKANAIDLRNDPDLATGQPGFNPVPPIPPIIGIPGFPGGGIGIPGGPGGVLPPPPPPVPDLPPEKTEKKSEEDKPKEK